MRIKKNNIRVFKTLYGYLKHSGKESHVGPKLVHSIMESSKMAVFATVFVAVFLLAAASATDRGVMTCEIVSKCWEIHIDANVYKDVFVKRCRLSTVYVTGSLEVTVHDSLGQTCDK